MGNIKYKLNNSSAVSPCDSCDLYELCFSNESSELFNTGQSLMELKELVNKCKSEFNGNIKLKSSIKLWIARDEGITDEDYEVVSKGKIHLFYDKPLAEFDVDTRIKKFTKARCIGEIPSYMYPELSEGTCIELNAEFNYK